MNRSIETAAAITLFALCAAAAPTTPKFKRLATLKSHPHPWSGFIQGMDGELYSTTGGTKIQAGEVFKITTGGQVTMVDPLSGQSHASLLLATDGNFYGTTLLGGKTRGGSIFTVTPAGTLTTIYSFCAMANCPDGYEVNASLVEGSDGNLYGTTFAGGAGSNGTIFKITLAGQLTTIYSFCAQPNCADGGGPEAPLIQAADGNFYGTTVGGGTGSKHYGTVFRITPAGVYSVLHSFCSAPSCADGGQPQSGLIQASDGNLYGTAEAPGVAYRITLDGAFQVLYTFCSKPKCRDGSYPTAPLIQATDGLLYGTTDGGGTKYGTAFRMTLDGRLTTIYTFCSRPNCTDGVSPLGPVFQATDGNLYGTTYGSTRVYPSTVYELKTGMGPFVRTQPAYGGPGSNISILGYNLTGATAVFFNGTSAAFVVNSTGTAITATIPPGATSGFIKVTLADGSILSSNVPFSVDQ